MDYLHVLTVASDRQRQILLRPSWRGSPAASVRITLHAARREVPEVLERPAILTGAGDGEQRRGPWRWGRE